jgi:uncharacterized ferritin-like protein (DUF455 family)
VTQSLAGAACAVLRAADPSDKVILTRRFSEDWRAGRLSPVGDERPPDRPARPPVPLLKPPRDMPRRRAAGSSEGRVALLHALAHIELNAIDLAWDLISRFGGPHLPDEFHHDWVAVAADEAKHFTLIEARLQAFGTRYGDLPAHDGLWEAAAATEGDVLARLAIVPLVLEARGLDVTPAMIGRLYRFGDVQSARVLEIVLADEISHVAAGTRWFRWECDRRDIEPVATWRALVGRHFNGALKPPFNDAARRAAGMEPAFYEALC